MALCQFALSTIAGSVDEAAKQHPAGGVGGQHSRLMACLSTLYLFSRTRPELLVGHAETLLPYLMLTSSANDQHVCVQVVNILERVIPLMEHPSETFIHKLEDDLLKLCQKGTIVSVICGRGWLPSPIDDVCKSFFAANRARGRLVSVVAGAQAASAGEQGGDPVPHVLP